MKKLILFLVIVGIISTSFIYVFYRRSLEYSINPQSYNRVSVTIDQGATAESIAQVLKDKNLIQSEWAFRFYVRVNDLSSQLKAGTMVIQENNTLPQIVDILVEGRSQEMAVTLLEGWTIRQIAEHMESQDFTTTEAFMDCIENCEFEFDFLPADYLEGYLYPDTYFVDNQAYTDQSFIQRLLQTFELKLTEDDWQGIEESGYTLEEIIIMASMVEREERVESEKATVAGVLWNRYEQGTLLGVDATVLYALDRTSGGITFQDLQVDSPYNTRKFAGMPPTPISNPNISSIRAAIFPEETEYWYYLHDSEGRIHYGRTLEEHNENKARYID